MPASKKGDSKAQPLMSREDVYELAGRVADRTVIAILETGASVTDLEIAAVHARGEGDRVGRLGHPLSGKAAQVADILAKDELYAVNIER